MKTLDELKAAWREAKAIEEEAKLRRLVIEKDIVALMPTKLEGTVSQDGVTVTYKVSRKCDTAQLQENWNDIPAAVQAAFKWMAEISTTSLRSLDESAMVIAQNYFTTTPAKPSVTLKD